MILTALFKTSLWNNIPPKNRKVRIFILGIGLYIVLYALLNSGYLKNITIVDKYKKYIYFLMAMDILISQYITRKSSLPHNNKHRKVQYQQYHPQSMYQYPYYQQEMPHSQPQYPSNIPYQPQPSPNMSYQNEFTAKQLPSSKQNSVNKNIFLKKDTPPEVNNTLPNKPINKSNSKVKNTILEIGSATSTIKIPIYKSKNKKD